MICSESSEQVEESLKGRVVHWRDEEWKCVGARGNVCE